MLIELPMYFSINFAIDKFSIVLFLIVAGTCSVGRYYACPVSCMYSLHIFATDVKEMWIVSFIFHFPCFIRFEALAIMKTRFTTVDIKAVIAEINAK